jgi:hypothetical protein
LLFKKSLTFYNNYIKQASGDSLFLCRMDLLFRDYIVPNIESEKIIIKPNDSVIIKLYFIYLILAFYTLFNLLLLKCKKIDKAHYFVDINNSKNYYDFRSKEILEVVPPESSANFMHISNVKYSLKTLHRKSNAIYFEAIYFVLKPFLKSKRFKYIESGNKFSNEVLEVHQQYYNDSYYIHKVVKWVLKFLNIKTFISLDDSRYSNEIIVASSDLNIRKIGYMHGRFNEYHLGIFEFPFDKYLVWSSYFKNKLLDISSRYKKEDIEVVGHFRIKEKLKDVQEKRNILWLGESNIEYKEITPFIDEIIENGYNLYFKGKPGNNNNLSDFLKNRNISIDNSSSFFECLTTNNIGLVVGTHSTALMESWIVGVPSLALKSSYDYGSHLWEDELIEICEDKSSLNKTIIAYFGMNSKQLHIVRNKIWGNNVCFNKNKTVSILVQQ